jgi:uncharacterized membrane protein (UPF0182 family)
MEETLDAALGRLFPGGGRAPTPSPIIDVDPERPDETAQGGAAAPAGDAAALAAQARAHYQRALQAQREGNWALYGEEIKRLGEVLDKMTRRP